MGKTPPDMRTGRSQSRTGSKNEITKARALSALGHADEARAVEQRAVGMGSEQQVYDFARSLQRLGQQDQAMAIFERNIAAHPDGWRAHLQRSRIAVANGDYLAARKEMAAAIGAVTPDLKPALTDLLRQLENGIDINK